MDSELLNDIAVGLVLHLDPKRLLGAGAQVTGPAATWVQGHHFFLCIEVEAKRTKWLPLYSGAGDKRVPLSADGRSGHEKWTSGTFHYHPAQVWSASRHAVVRAAHDGGDMSTSSARNLLDPALVPNLQKDV